MALSASAAFRYGMIEHAPVNLFFRVDYIYIESVSGKLRITVIRIESTKALGEALVTLWSVKSSFNFEQFFSLF